MKHKHQDSETAIRQSLGLWGGIWCHLAHSSHLIREALWDRIAGRQVSLYCCGKCKTQFLSFQARFSPRLYKSIGDVVNGDFTWESPDSKTEVRGENVVR